MPCGLLSALDLYNLRSYEDQEFLTAAVVAGVLEETSEIRDIAEDRHLTDGLGDLLLVDAAENNGLAVSDQYLGLYSLGVDFLCGTGTGCNSITRGVLSYLQVEDDGVVRSDLRSNLESENCFLPVN